MIFRTADELVDHINIASKYVEKAYGEIAREIREKSSVVFLTPGWLKSPGCSSSMALSSLLRRIDVYHSDLGFFTRYIAPYYEARERRDLGLIVYDNPAEPWRSYVARHIKSLSLLGLGGIFIKSGEAAAREEGEAEEVFRVIEIPKGIDVLLAHHMVSLRAILDIASEIAISPRVARILSELRELGSVVPDMIKRYGETVREIGSRIRGGDAILMATCASRSFFEGLLLDGCKIPALLDAHEFQGLSESDRRDVVVAYIETEKDLLPAKLMNVKSGRFVELILKTDPITSPIYFRLLSMISALTSLA